MGISYSQVTICFIFLCCEKGAYSNAYNRFNSYSFEPFLLESIVRQTGRGHPDTYGEWVCMGWTLALQGGNPGSNPGSPTMAQMQSKREAATKR